MARIDNNGSRSVKTSRPASEPTPQAPAEKAASKTESKPNTVSAKPAGDLFEGKKPDSFVPERSTKSFSKGTQGDIRRLANSPKAAVTTNKDGSVTRTKSVKDGQATRTQELTTDKGLLGDSKLKFSTTSKKGNTETKNEFSSQTDVLRRTQSSHQREVSTTKGDTTKTQSRTETTDTWGTKKETRAESTKVTQGDHSETQSQSVTTDKKGNRAWSNSVTTTDKSGKTTVKTTTKDSGGTERTSNSTQEFKEGKLTVGEAVDWKSSKFNKEKSFSRETELSPSAADQGFSQARKDDKLGYAQKVGNLLGAAGLKVDLAKGELPKDLMHENNLSQDPNSFVGSRVGVAGSHNVSIGADGLNASFKREAKAGLYAETKGSTKGEWGEASYNAGAKVEAKASVDAKGKLDLNGLDASVNAKVGVTAEASASGKAQTQSINVAGVDLNASVEGTAKASVSASAEATGKVKVTRNPPTAIAEGTVGASAVAKIEGEVKASAGPFSVTASGYASAGAEAKASGTIGFEDGKLKIGGSAGAALGLGAGGAVNVEIDVAQIGEMAKNTAVKAADVNGDGKLGIDDAEAVVNGAKDLVTHTVHEAKAAVSNTVNEAKAVVNNAKDKVLGWLGF
ncbi:hypothetical protein POL68_01830 [Stigmatella sp. ncwal1]|uniref:EF-hand domain-containing protein n=1 Tax=Stigmatella ashevillensis TaxID=2995309 RepID=A0ABT5D0K9_9BACT|nr:hypothetical protein [Stigmatella ashevillena]MDC0707198.1 hypothetical protein [Stigmatella ashevillena]